MDDVGFIKIRSQFAALKPTQEFAKGLFHNPMSPVISIQDIVAKLKLRTENHVEDLSLTQMRDVVYTATSELFSDGFPPESHLITNEIFSHPC